MSIQQAQKHSAKGAIPSASNRQNNSLIASDHIPTFVRCLRLLDFDLLQDWPGITEQTFSTKSVNQNLQTRVKCVEWSLFRLFEQYDRGETSKKLRPFFPPATPLQSLNLRAALFRSLTELKKNGVLGRDAVLRKTMLDECKGEKFEEVLATFAMIVLKKRIASLPYISNSLSSAKKIGNLPQDQLIALILAHRTSLQQQLGLRNSFKEKCAAYAQFLTNQEDELERRQRVLLAQSSATDSGSDSSGPAEGLLRNTWTGDGRWVEILLNGREFETDLSSDVTFETSWANISAAEEATGATTQSVMDNLDRRIAIQTARLSRWKAFQSSLEKSRKPERKESVVARRSTSLSNILSQFDRHKSLQTDTQRSIGPGHVELIPAHEKLLASMESELSTLRGSNQPPTLSEVEKHHKDHYPTGRQQSLHAQTASNDLNETRKTGQASEQQYGSSSDVESMDQTFSAEEKVASAELFKEHLQSEISTFATLKESNQKIECSANESEHSLQVVKDIDTPDKSTMTLLERTQLSMFATKHTVDGTIVPGVLSSPIHSSLMPPPSATTATAATIPPKEPAAQTLLERTRLSMSLLPNHQQHQSGSHGRKTASSRSKDHHQTQTIYPINPFDTISSSTTTTTETPPATVPAYEDLDEASAFKSRPRVAISPPPTLPTPTHGQRYGDEHEDEDEDLYE